MLLHMEKSAPAAQRNATGQAPLRPITDEGVAAIAQIVAFIRGGEARSRAEIVERTDHPWFVAVQYHPEFKSKPNKAHPLFVGFIEAALAK